MDWPFVGKGTYKADVQYQLYNAVKHPVTGVVYQYVNTTAGTGKPLPVEPATSTEYWMKWGEPGTPEYDAIEQRLNRPYNLDARIDDIETKKGQASGFASLGANGKIPSSQLPASSGGVTLQTADKHLLVFGDSIAETASMNDDGTGYEVYWTRWPTYTFSDLDFATIKNYSKSGATLKDVGASPSSFRRWMSNQIGLAVTAEDPADVIVISAGTNDGASSGAVGDYATAMGKATLGDLDKSKLYEALRWHMWKIRTQWPAAMCFIGLPIQRAGTDSFTANYNTYLLEPMRVMARRYNFIPIEATYESGIVVDFEVNGGAGRYLVDGLHPSEPDGNRLLANLYTRGIRNAMNY